MGLTIQTARYSIDLLTTCLRSLGCSRSNWCGTTILMYHRVLPDVRWKKYPQSDLVVPESAFAAQMAWLARRCEVLTVADALSTPTSRRMQPRVCLTFDDGFQDNAEVAAPILERHGLRGTFYVTTKFVETNEPLWFDLASLHWLSLPRPFLKDASREGGAVIDTPALSTLVGWLGYLKSLTPAARAAVMQRLESHQPLQYDSKLFAAMSTVQIRDLSARGHEIGAHTATHPRLPQLDDESLWSELEGPRKKLMLWTGTEIIGVSYPNGDHDNRVTEMARKAGFRYGCTTRRGINVASTDLMRLQRRRVTFQSVSSPWGTHSDASFQAEVMGIHDRIRSGLRGVRRPNAFGQAPIGRI